MSWKRLEKHRMPSRFQSRDAPMSVTARSPQNGLVKKEKWKTKQSIWSGQCVYTKKHVARTHKQRDTDRERHTDRQTDRGGHETPEQFSKVWGPTKSWKAKTTNESRARWIFHVGEFFGGEFWWKMGELLEGEFWGEKIMNFEWILGGEFLVNFLGGFIVNFYWWIVGGGFFGDFFRRPISLDFVGLKRLSKKSPKKSPPKIH